MTWRLGDSIAAISVVSVLIGIALAVAIDLSKDSIVAGLKSIARRLKLAKSGPTLDGYWIATFPCEPYPDDPSRYDVLEIVRLKTVQDQVDVSYQSYRYGGKADIYLRRGRSPAKGVRMGDTIVCPYQSEGDASVVAGVYVLAFGEFTPDGAKSLTGHVIERRSGRRGQAGGELFYAIAASYQRLDARELGRRRVGWPRTRLLTTRTDLDTFAEQTAVRSAIARSERARRDVQSLPHV